MSVARHHADWLSLLEISGPFVTMPVLMRVFPQGLDPRDPEQARQLRLAYEVWQGSPSGPGKQRSWISHVLTQLLNFPADLIAEGQGLLPGLSAAMPEYGETLRPDLALVGPKGTDAAGKPQLLLSIYPPDQSLDRPVAGKHWKAAPPTRMMELLHASDIPLGLVTNGEQWMLVFAPRGETTGFTSWYGTLWIEEPITLRAFHSLLSINRFFGVAATETLSALLNESAQDQQEVTNQLGDQVRDAVEVLIRAFDGLDDGSGRTLLKGVEEKTLYDAALTVMMRLVFLFSAEERDLLHLGRPIYDNNYAVSTLREQLQEVADRYGEEVLERRFDAWARLLSSFRAVHGGVQHQDLLLPPYGGSLFDPDRYSFLEGRGQETDWRVTAADPLAINNRVVLHLLKSLQMLQVRVAGGGQAEARRISFRALDIEQIGHIYEGLLDHTAFRARETVLGLTGTRKNPTPSINLDEVERLAEQGEGKLLEELEEQTGRGIPALKKAMETDAAEENHKILVACSQNEKLAERIARFAGLLREDSFDRPVIVLAGSIYVSAGTARRSTGTHYTPRSLTEPIVKYTLEPLVYRGPSEGLPKDQWELKSPQEILSLKVCDMAMGSGAFLVQVCRYLSERLVEAWENIEKAHPGELLITPEGLFSKGESSERLIPQDSAERLAIARRLIADRCLYGVDINPMAVEMAKLSIWLITVDKSRPFTFLDHALKCGDSLLGLCRFKQLETFSLDEKHAKQVIILSNYGELIGTAIAKRRELEVLPSNDAAQIAAKKTLLAEAEECLEKLKLAADLLLSAELTEGNARKKEMARAAAHIKVTHYIQRPTGEFRHFSREQLGENQPFHWPLEFAEVLERGGFDALVGNPPFMGGRYISGAFGNTYLEYLKVCLANGVKGNADLVAYFYLRACSLLCARGYAGFVGTKTITEGDTLDVGLFQFARIGVDLYRAETALPWPGTASVIYSTLHWARGPWSGPRFLNSNSVEYVGPRLDGDRRQEPFPLRQRIIPYQGSYIHGDGFLLNETQRNTIVAGDPHSAECIFPCLTGDDFNTSPSIASDRFAIYFGELEEDQARVYKGAWDHVEREVKPLRLQYQGTALAKYWWRYKRATAPLYKSIWSGNKFLACAVITKYLAFVWMPSRIILMNKIYAFLYARSFDFAVLQSSFYDCWVRRFSANLGQTLQFAPTDCFDNFPLTECEALEEVSSNYHEYRQNLMRETQAGITKLYNRFHDRADKSADIDRLRSLQIEMDRAVAAAYGWNDLELGHDFWEGKQGERFTISDSARSKVLDRLLALNLQRYEAETLAGLHETSAKATSGKRSGPNKSKTAVVQDDLFISEAPE